MSGDKNLPPASLGSARSFSSDSGVMTISSEQAFLASDFDDPSLTPVSPSSAFSVSSIGNIEHSFVDALVLCHWDNILGPRLEHVWYVNGRPQPHTNILRFVTAQVLSGEICRDVHNSQVDFKFFDIPDKGIIIPSFIFSAQGSSGLSLQALALIIPNSELSVYLHQVELIHSWFIRIVAKLRVICAKRDFGTSGLADLSTWLWTCMNMLSSLQEAGLPSRVQLSDTAFCPALTLEMDFLRQAIASHLMTFGRSVVIGKRADRVNVIVYTLGLFLWESERFCSRGALDGQKWPYFQDLCVQGCVKSADGTFNLSVRELLCSQYPTTIIDVDHRDITQSSLAADHRSLSHQSLMEELEELYQGQEGLGEGPTGTFQTAILHESLVKELVDDIHKLPAENGIREAYIRHFMHTIQRKAFCLIKCLESDSVLPTGRINVKRLRQDLGLQLDGDFRIIMATADKLCPGFYQHVMGERKYETDYLPSMTDVL